jgi:methyl-accepting chemotaxis protein
MAVTDQGPLTANAAWGNGLGLAAIALVVIGWLLGAFIAKQFLSAFQVERSTFGGSLEENIKNLIASLQNLTTTLTEKTAEVSRQIGLNQERAAQSATAAAKATESSTIIAGATQELDSSIAEIGRQATDAAAIATKTLAEAQATVKIEEQLKNQNQAAMKTKARPKRSRPSSSK